MQLITIPDEDSLKEYLRLAKARMSNPESFEFKSKKLFKATKSKSIAEYITDHYKTWDAVVRDKPYVVTFLADIKLNNTYILDPFIYGDNFTQHSAFFRPLETHREECGGENDTYNNRKRERDRVIKDMSNFLTLIESDFLKAIKDVSNINVGTNDQINSSNSISSQLSSNQISSSSEIIVVANSSLGPKTDSVGISGADSLGEHPDSDAISALIGLGQNVVRFSASSHSLSPSTIDRKSVSTPEGEGRIKLKLAPTKIDLKSVSTPEGRGRIKGKLASTPIQATWIQCDPLGRDDEEYPDELFMEVLNECRTVGRLSFLEAQGN